MELTCVIIDDEPLARECIANYVGEVDFLKLVGTGNNPTGPHTASGEVFSRFDLPGHSNAGDEWNRFSEDCPAVAHGYHYHSLSNLCVGRISVGCHGLSG